MHTRIITFLIVLQLNGLTSHLHKVLNAIESIKNLYQLSKANLTAGKTTIRLKEIFSNER